MHRWTNPTSVTFEIKAIKCYIPFVLTLFYFYFEVEEEVANLKEKLEVSDMKCSLLTEECSKMKSQLEELLKVKEVSLCNPLSPSTHMHILLTVLYMFPIFVVGRI